MALGIGRLAHVMQQQCQVKHARMIGFAKHLLVIDMGRVLGIEHAVQVFYDLQCVFVGCVTVKKFMLDQAGEPTEFR